MVYGSLPFEHGLTFLLEDAAGRFRRALRGWHRARTWAEFWAAVPESDRRSLQAAAADADRPPLPESDAPFDRSMIPGVEDGDYPVSAHIDGWRWMPEPIRHAYGITMGGGTAGQWVVFAPADEHAIVEELREAGFTLRRDDTLVGEACGWERGEGDEAERHPPVTRETTFDADARLVPDRGDRIVDAWYRADPVTATGLLWGMNWGPNRDLSSWVTLGELLQATVGCSWHLAITIDARSGGDTPTVRGSVGSSDEWSYAVWDEDAMAAAVQAMAGACNLDGVDVGHAYPTQNVIPLDNRVMRDLLHRWARKEPSRFHQQEKSPFQLLAGGGVAQRARAEPSSGGRSHARSCPRSLRGCAGEGVVAALQLRPDAPPRPAVRVPHQDRWRNACRSAVVIPGRHVR